MRLGCIADDLTGATDLGVALSQGGLRTIQTIGVPDGRAALPAADAVVVALKSRTAEPARAVAETLASADALLAAGARQLYFKYCSTFDSTDRGNIGPVIEAVMDRYDVAFTIACPAYPRNGRTVYQSRLFVGAELLHESPMRDHPLTPMRESHLVKVLQRQTRLRVCAITREDVARGAGAIAAAIERERRAGGRIAIVDAVEDDDLIALGAACRDLALVTGGSGLALGLAPNLRSAGGGAPIDAASCMPAPGGASAVLAGSCSAATRRQIEVALENGMPAYRLDPLALASGAQTADQACAWAATHLSDRPVLVYSSAAPDAVGAVHDRLGRDAAGRIVEETLGEIGRRLVEEHGVARLIVAGGETSGAVVAALGIKAMEIGPEIDPGVPWTKALGARPLAIALKSGNFGASDFFLRAWERLA
jgi:uncharacterized protein YgbK (DUF1537 family)